MRLKKFPTCQQLDAKDCGPACLQIICKYYGRYYDLEYLREITGTRKEGSTVYDLLVALEKIEIKSIPLKTSYKKLHAEIPLPCIAYWKGNHFIVVYKVTEKHVYVSDPQIGLIKYTKQEFAKGWLGYIQEKDAWKKGVCIALEPTSDFQKDKDNKDHQKPNYISAFNFIAQFIKPYKKEVLQILLVLTALTLMGVLIPIITQTIIDRGISSRDISFIGLMMVSALVLNISSSLGTWVQQSINMHFSVRVKISMLSDYLSQLFKLPLSFFENRLMGDLLQRSYDYDRIESVVLYAFFNTVLGVMTFVVFGALLAYYHVTIFLVFLGLSGLYMLWTFLFLSIRRKMDIRYFSYIAANHSHWMEILSRILDIKSYGFGKNKIWQWEKVQIGLYKTRTKLLHVDQMEQLGGNIINTVKNLLVIYIAVISVIEGDMTIGVLISVQYIMGQLNNPLNSIIQFISTAQLAYISYMRISEIKNSPAEELENSIPKGLVKFGQDIYFKNVYFKYSVNEDFILKSNSFKIPGCSLTALVGASGSGKSTLIKLLMQLYRPSSGDMLLGEQHFLSIAASDWRSECGIITQESSILRDTILSNIVFGRPFETIDLLNIQIPPYVPMGYIKR